jgi:hypothetical protein
MIKKLLPLILLLACCAPAAAQDSTAQRVVGVNAEPTAGTCDARKLYKLIVAPYTLWKGGSGGACVVVGAGDVAGAASSTDNAVARYDGTAGKTLQNSAVTVDDSGSVNIPAGQSYKINNVALGKADVGLSSVDNTSDASKPVSTAQQTALNLKAPLASPSFTGAPAAPSVTLNGTGGAGFAEFAAQSSNPSAPAGGFRTFADSSGRFSWRRASDGFVRTFDATLTADRVFTFPDASGAFVLDTATQTLTNKTLTAPTVGSFANANHTHQNAAGGGTLDAAALGSGTLGAARMPAFTGDCTTSAGSVATTCTQINGVDQTAAWTTYTPTITIGSGSLTAYAAYGRYRQLGKTVFVRITVSITTNGTAAGAVNATLPFAVKTDANAHQVMSGVETSNTGKLLRGIMLSGGSTVEIKFYDSTYPGANGNVLTVEGVYESN